MTEDNSYALYRGKCKELSEKYIADNPDSGLRLVRGYYHCPLWGKQDHWWVETPNGTIVDPTVKQFPTAGAGAEYEEFNGAVECAECGKELPEEDARFDGRYAFCSTRCNMRFVGL